MSDEAAIEGEGIESPARLGEGEGRSGGFAGQPWFGVGLGSVLPALAGLLLVFSQAGRPLADLSYDLLFVLALDDPVKDVVVVELTETCYSALGQDPASFSRTNHALLVDRLKAAGAKMVVFDILFIDEPRTNQWADAEFIRAMREHGKVVLGAGYQPPPPPLESDGNYFPPSVNLRTNAAGWGVAMVEWDVDFEARRHYPERERYPSLGWKAAELAGAEVTKHPERRRTERWLNYYADNAFEHVPYWAVVLNMSAFVSGSLFEGKTVFVGAGALAGYSGEEKEQFKSPRSWFTGKQWLGVDLHALTFTNLERGDWLSRVPKWIEGCLAVLLGALFGYGLALFRPVGGLLVGLGGALAVCVGSFLLFAWFKFWFVWLVVVGVQLPLAYGWSLLFHSIKAHMETQFLARSLGFYVSPHQVKQLLKKQELLKPGGVSQEVTVLFSDIAGFSKHCEVKRWEPHEIMQQLNQYYNAAISCIYKTDGTVMDLVGDAIFALWNAPEKQPDHQKRACRSAILLHETLVTFDKNQALPWRTRIGLHTGEVCIGNIGSETRFDYTAVGDTINLASRMEGLNKQLGTTILATGKIQKSFGPQVVSRWVGNFRFKGLNQVVEVHEIIGDAKREEDSRPWREVFAEAMRLFVRRDFDLAAEQFRRTMELREKDLSEVDYQKSHQAHDGPSEFYLEILKGSFSPAKDWMGEIDLTGK